MRCDPISIRFHAEWGLGSALYTQTVFVPSFAMIRAATRRRFRYRHVVASVKGL